MFRQFYRQMNIEQAITLSYHHQSNDQMEVCIKFVNCIIKKYLDTNADMINSHRCRLLILPHCYSIDQ